MAKYSFPRKYPCAGMNYCMCLATGKDAGGIAYDDESGVCTIRMWDNYQDIRISIMHGLRYFGLLTLSAASIRIEYGDLARQRCLDLLNCGDVIGAIRY